MRTVPLGEVTEPIQTWSPGRTSAGVFRYIDVGGVDSSTKRIVRSAIIAAAEAPSRARQIVASGDVLVSTVRPNLNAVAVVPTELDGATASTGFTVLRPKPDIVGSYLFHWVRNDAFIGEMVQKATGASYPAVSDRIIKASRMPLPSTREQERIAAILDAADAIRATRRTLLTNFDPLTRHVFEEFLAAEMDELDTVPFAQVADLVGGRNLVAEDRGLDSPFRVLKVSAVTSGRFKPHESKPLPAAYVPPKDHLVREGDLLMSRANTTELVGAVAYVDSTPPNLALPDKVWRFVWRDQSSVPLFYSALFQTPGIRRRISALSSGSGGSMKNVSKVKLGLMQIPRVSPGRQRAVADRLAAINAQRARVQRALAADDELFSSLQLRAFSGGL